MRCESFPPIVGLKPKILILGSMPGSKSLAQFEYYAHPQNLFWRIIENAFSCPFESPYEQRVACLKSHKVAVWDVLASCHRKGSLDRAIEHAVVNPLEEFIAENPSVEKILFNGQTAFKQFDKKFPNWTGPLYEILPSTSPANASIPREQKMAQWAQALHFA